MAPRLSMPAAPIPSHNGLPRILAMKRQIGSQNYFITDWCDMEKFYRCHFILRWFSSMAIHTLLMSETTYLVQLFMECCTCCGTFRSSFESPLVFYGYETYLLYARKCSAPEIVGSLIQRKMQSVYHDLASSAS